jgi:hypothetical protein
MRLRATLIETRIGWPTLHYGHAVKWKRRWVQVVYLNLCMFSAVPLHVLHLLCIPFYKTALI